jgi:hypothetical protein
MSAQDHRHRHARLGAMHEIVERIRRANHDENHRLAGKLSEHLAELLSESPEHLLSTQELADWEFSSAQKQEGDELASNALDEIRSVAVSYGPSSSWH